MRLSIDFTDLNRACPKDPFPLPRIDQVVDSTAGCDLLCFLDAFSGYHQIKMAIQDEENTSFITSVGCYCYTCMPFGLKNVGAAFQRAMRLCLGSQMGRNVEAYIDDILVKSRDKATMVEDLQETFDNLRKANLRLNPEKCIFGVPSGKLLGFLVSQRGIEAKPDKIKAIEDMQPPRRVKDVQRLNGCITALGRFISRLGERALPFFRLLNKKGPFEWTPEADQAFLDLKKYLSSPPILVSPRPGELLLLYAHQITVVSDYGLESVLRNREVTGRIAEWATELSEFELRFSRIHAIKSKVLVDFINEWTQTPIEPWEELSSLPGNEDQSRWTMYFDGSFGYHGAGAGVVIVSPTGEKLKYAIHLDFDDEEKSSNNMTEYEALLVGLRAAAGLGIKKLVVRGDSQLVVNQVIKEYDCPQMWAYVDDVRRLERRFHGLQLEHIPQGDNFITDELSKLAAQGGPVPSGVFLERLTKPSVGVPPGVQPLLPQYQGPREQLKPGSSEILPYLVDCDLPEEDKQADRIVRQATMYCIIDGELYRKRECRVKLRCISGEQGQALLADIHEGTCANHVASRALAGKAFRQGLYCPTALADAKDLVRTCDACQFHAKSIRQPAQALQTIPVSWPFATWGLDIVGKFPRVVGGHEYLMVSVDKFTKWVEVEPVRAITALAAIKLIRGIVCRFGVERANAEVLRGLRTRTFDRFKTSGRNWIEEFPTVLWALRTTPSRATGETPFSLVYGAEAVLPTELKYGSRWVRAYDDTIQRAERINDVNFLEEVRSQAAVQSVRYQQSLRRYHIRRVHPRELELGDLVLRRKLYTKGMNKLSPKWEGPFWVAHITRPGSVQLETEDGQPVPNL
ncbi:hypothetical protein ACQ4PT_050237 [Festuca glaucescens]